MSEDARRWRPIESAPKDGTPIRARRVYKGQTIFDGPVSWRTVHFPALPPHPLDGDIYAPAYDATGWMRLESEQRAPKPTHWMPLPDPPPQNRHSR